MERVEHPPVQYVGDSALTLATDPRPSLARSEDVVALVRRFRNRTKEHFIALYVDARNRLIGRPVVISIGSLSASIVHPREIFREACKRAAAGFMVVHNHPSGDPEPSPEDVSVTRRLAEAGELMGVELLDHVIIARRGHVSLNARGHI